VNRAMEAPTLARRSKGKRQKARFAAPCGMARPGLEPGTPRFSVVPGSTTRRDAGRLDRAPNRLVRKMTRRSKYTLVAVVRDALGTPNGVGCAACVGCRGVGACGCARIGRRSGKAPRGTVQPVAVDSGPGAVKWAHMAWSSESARVVRVVAVSPGDVMGERRRLEKVVDELNRRLAPAHGCLLSLWRWETDAHSGLHLEGPQGLIDVAMRIENADVVVGIFWKRFGTPTLDAGSGTEHELRRAWSAWRENGRPQVMVYFCQRPHMPQSSAEAAQLQQVLSFREAMPEQQLWWTYTSAGDFERAMREHLTALVLTMGLGPGPAAAAQAITAVRNGRRVRFRLPLVASYFTGRGAELDAIDAALGVADRAVVTQAITGLGGVGKSQLAGRYVHQRADEYDVVAWIRAEDGGIADLSDLATELGLPVAQQTPAQLAASAVRWLSGLEFPRFRGHLTAGPSGPAWRMSIDAQDRAVFQGVQA